MPQDDVHEAGALVGDLASAAFGVMGEAEAMVLDFEESLVEGKELGRALLALQGKLGLGMGEDFLPVAGDGIEGRVLGFGRRRGASGRLRFPAHVLLLTLGKR